MRTQFLLGIALPTTMAMSTLADVCTPTYIQSVLPAPGFLRGVDILPASVTANPVLNFTVNGGTTAPSITNRDFCNVTLTYAKTGRSDKVTLWLYLPAPSQFLSRFLATGGGGYAITSGERGLSAGLPYGAASATTDGGFGSFRTDLASVILRADGTLNYDMLYAFAYTAIHEMSAIGKALIQNFYGKQRIYAYYSGCSEGGREGLAQIQRYGTQFDGAAIGAPAIRQAFLQVGHLFPAVAENARGVWPSACELERINADAIEACDGLDGRVDGVVARSDLCLARVDARDSVGRGYACPAGRGAPAVEGRVSVEAAELANALWRGFFDSKGRRVYVTAPPAAGFGDAATTYNATMKRFEAVAGGIGVQYVNLFLQEIRSSTLSLAGVTYDTLRAWILEGMKKFTDTVQTTWPDLEEFRDNGGKIIHWHGEADGGIPAVSSTIYVDAVRKTMYPGLGFNESIAKLGEWYRFFLVPGAGHCGPYAAQPNGPFPQDILQAVIDWVEKGMAPVLLNATVLGGPQRGSQEKLCSWPLRPLWKDGIMECVYHQPSVDTWLPKLDSIPIPVY